MTKEKTKELLAEAAPMLKKIEQEDELQIQVIGIVADALMTGVEIGKRSVGIPDRREHQPNGERRAT